MKRKLKRRKKKSKKKPSLRIEQLDGHRICFQCYYKNKKTVAAAREDIIGIFSGQGASIPPGLQLALCPRHFRKLHKLMGDFLGV